MYMMPSKGPHGPEIIIRKILVRIYDDRQSRKYKTPETYNPEYNITTLPEKSYRCVKFWCVNTRSGNPESYDYLETCNLEYNFPEKFYRCGKFWCVHMTTGFGKPWCVYMTTDNPESYDDPETYIKYGMHYSGENPTAAENPGASI